MLREWLHRLWGSLRRNARERDMEEELRRHLEFAAEHEGSERAARVAYGGVTQAMESIRDQRGLPWIDNLVFDLRYGLRTLRTNPGFNALAVSILALGIGANTAVFSVVNAVLIRPLSYNDPGRIVSLTNPHTSGEDSSPLDVKFVSVPNFQDWHDQSSSFEAMAFYYSWENPVSTGATAEYARVAKVSPEFFRVFAVAPAIGRFFSTEEMKPNSNGALMIGYSYWQNHFGGDPGVLGKTIRRYSAAQKIVGVLPPGFGFPDETDLWFPDNDDSPSFHNRDAQNHLVVGRLKPGASIERARTEMTAIAQRLQRQYPLTNKNRTVAVTRIQDQMVGDVRSTLYLLLAAVGVVLLISCANTATLLLGRATVRAREIVIRAALGAGPRRIMRQLLTESALLALLGGAAGLLLAYGGSRALIALAPADLPRLAEIGIDGRVLAFTLGLSILTSVLFGIAPAVCASQVELNDALKQTRSVIGGMVRIRGALVVGEIALAVALLSVSGLLIKSFIALNSVAMGFRPEHVLVMRATGPGSIRDTNIFFKDVVAQIRAVPGVLAAGATMTLPGHIGSSGYYFLDHLPAHHDNLAPDAANAVVTPGTFAALGIPLKAGRDFNDGDTVGNPRVAIVNEALVRKSGSGADVIGRTIFCGFDSEAPMTIVGIVGDVRENGPARDPAPECYMPNRQHFYNNTSLSVVVRTAGDPKALEATVRRLAHDRSSDVPVTFTTLESDVYQSFAAPRFRTVLFTLFAGLAVCLAMAGVYGVMAYAVGQRSGEIGIRMALGASAGSVVRLVLRQGLVLASIGLALGLAAAFSGTRLVRAMLFQVKPNDPSVYFLVAALLCVVALLASYVPAKRASRVDPLEALRQE
ncbi:MAG: ABC transporter permease [Bryobacterales bacterium]|nr:ABC transporter permease [Bryobacterales bacterium]MBV9398889.1 ABC transporter permease [Bryobacterales bacterium]